MGSILLVLLLALVVSAAPATATPPTALEIKADVLRADTVRGIVEARGRVRISDGRSLVRAGVAVYTIKQRKISLSGGVTMTTPESDLQARAAVADRKSVV